MNVIPSPPKCKLWHVGRAGTFMKLPHKWQHIREWQARGFFPPDAEAKPTDETLPPCKIESLPFFTQLPPAKLVELTSAHGEALAEKYPISKTQKEILITLGWPFDNALLKNYYWADKVIHSAGWQGGCYADIESPWFWSIPAEQEQIEYLRSHGIKADKYLTKDGAKELIREVKKCQPKRSYITPRQMMVLRFWNKTPESGWSVDEVSHWLDSWHAEDTNRLAAWELFKKETNDNGEAEEYAQIPVGIGFHYLEKIKAIKSPASQP